MGPPSQELSNSAKGSVVQHPGGVHTPGGPHAPHSGGGLSLFSPTSGVFLLVFPYFGGDLICCTLSGWRVKCTVFFILKLFFVHR